MTCDLTFSRFKEGKNVSFFPGLLSPKISTFLQPRGGAIAMTLKGKEMQERRECATSIAKMREELNTMVLANGRNLETRMTALAGKIIGKVVDYNLLVVRYYVDSGEKVPVKKLYSFFRNGGKCLPCCQDISCIEPKHWMMSLTEARGKRENSMVVQCISGWLNALYETERWSIIAEDW